MMTLDHTRPHRACSDLHHARAVSLFIALLCVAAVADAQSGATKEIKDAKEVGSVAGRVTNNGRAAAGMMVSLQPTEWSPQRKATAQATTDENGRYHLKNVPPGRYSVAPLAPGYVFAEVGGNSWQPGQAINLAPGEELQNLDFTLVRGGVITGRVTDADGKPVVEQAIRLVAANAADRKRPQYQFNPFGFPTDDRGVYRYYGLPAGRYLVSVGESKDNGITYGGDIGGYYARTFHPNTTEEAQAKVVEVLAGTEVSGVDIALGKLSKTFAVAGRVVDEAGQPVANASYLHGSVSDDGKRFDGGFASDGKTNAQGEFVAKGLTPGRWALWAMTGEPFAQNAQTTTYSDPVAFEIDDHDITGIEIKMRAGASLSGVLVIEGASNPATVAKLSEVKLAAQNREASGTLIAPTFGNINVNPDGTFRLTGLRPGKLTLNLGWPVVRGLSLLSIRRDGVDQPDGIEVRAGEQVRNVRVAVAYGTNTVRGQLLFRNGTRPETARYYVATRRVGGSAPVVNGWVEVDALNRFVIEDLSAGDYEITLRDGSTPEGRDDKRAPLAKQTVTLNGDNTQAQVTLTLDLSAPVKAQEDK